MLHTIQLTKRLLSVQVISIVSVLALHFSTFYCLQVIKTPIIEPKKPQLIKMTLVTVKKQPKLAPIKKLKQATIDKPAPLTLAKKKAIPVKPIQKKIQKLEKKNLITKQVANKVLPSVQDTKAVQSTVKKVDDTHKTVKPTQDPISTLVKPKKVVERVSQPVISKKVKVVKSKKVIKNKQPTDNKDKNKKSPDKKEISKNKDKNKDKNKKSPDKKEISKNKDKNKDKHKKPTHQNKDPVKNKVKNVKKVNKDTAGKKSDTIHTVPSPKVVKTNKVLSSGKAVGNNKNNIQEKYITGTSEQDPAKDSLNNTVVAGANQPVQPHITDSTTVGGVNENDTAVQPLSPTVKINNSSGADKSNEKTPPDIIDSKSPRKFGKSEVSWERKPKLILPDSIRRRVNEGDVFTVILRVDIDKQGTITSVKAQQSSGNRYIDRSVISDVRRAKFYPVAVSGFVIMPITHTIR